MRYIIITILALLAAQTKAQLSDSLSEKLLHQELVYWQAGNDSVKFCALLAKAKLNREVGLYATALNELYRAEDIYKGNHELAEMHYEKMLNYFLSNQYYSCSQVIIDSIDIAEHYNNYLLMRLYSLNETENWSTCKELLLKYCNTRDTMQIAEIKKLPTGYKLKSFVKAKRLSAIFPGLGETYAGYPFKGFTSFVLNAGFLFFAGYNFYTAYYVTGAVSGIFPFLRFYGGGKRLSKLLAINHNEIKAAELKKKYWKEISSVLH